MGAITGCLAGHTWKLFPLALVDLFLVATVATLLLATPESRRGKNMESIARRFKLPDKGLQLAQTEFITALSEEGPAVSGQYSQKQLQQLNQNLINEEKLKQSSTQAVTFAATSLAVVFHVIFIPIFKSWEDKDDWQKVLTHTVSGLSGCLGIGIGLGSAFTQYTALLDLADETDTLLTQ